MRLKRWIAALMSVALALGACAANAEGKRHSISDIAALSQGGWRETYQAYGRTIQVDLEIEVPAVDKAPVLLVEEMPALDEQRQRELDAFYNHVQDVNPINASDFRSDDYATTWAYKLPYRLDEKAGETMLTVKWPRRAQMAYDWTKAYADNNPLTLQDAFDIALERFHDVFPDIDLMVKDVALEDRYLNKKTGEPIREMGGYLMICRQLFHGIPQITRADRTFLAVLSSDAVDEIPFVGDYEVRATVVADDAYSLFCKMIREMAVLHEDIPLLPFDDVKPAIAALVQSGNVRNVYKVQLAYVVFDNPDDLNNTFVLLPCWVAWCEYYRDAKEEMSVFDKNAPYFETFWYRPIILNAQTGALLDPKSVDPLRARCPEIIPW